MMQTWNLKVALLLIHLWLYLGIKWQQVSTVLNHFPQTVFMLILEIILSIIPDIFSYCICEQEQKLKYFMKPKCSAIKSNIFCVLSFISLFIAW